MALTGPLVTHLSAGGQPRCHQSLLTGERLADSIETASCPYCWVLNAVAARRALEGRSPIPTVWEAFWVDKCRARDAAATGDVPVANLRWTQEMNEALLVWCAIETVAALDRSA